MFTYYDNANRAYYSLAAREKNRNLTFDKYSPRDDKMYYINEGNNLKKNKDQESFL